MGRRRFGSVRRLPSGRWQARYRTPDGRLHTAPQTFATKTDATRFLVQAEADLTRGTWSDPRLGRTPFAAWAERWRATTVNLRPNTRATYDRLLRHYLLPAFAATPLAEIDALAVRAWLAGMEAAGVGASTRAKCYRLLSRVLGQAVEAGYLARNPCTVRGAASDPAAEMRFATVAQVAELAEAVPPRYRALVLVAAYAGLRWGELAGLRAKRVDLLHRQVTVAEQLTEVRGAFAVAPPKTAAGLRTVTLPQVAASALAEHLAAYAEPGPEGLVFPAERRGPLRRSNFNRRVWAPATRAVGVEGLRFHDLRHTAATLAVAAGASTRELMARLGHASSAAALRYQHVMAGRDQAIAAALDELVQAAAALDEGQPAGRSGTRVARSGQTSSRERGR
ncbi:MAG TPA: tyrosine-type recombinase/integrase [Actinomycetota bacterium]|jgi:integrase